MGSFKPLFATAVQPSIISLFSSTGSDPLAIFSSCTDKSLPADSFIHFLHDRLSLPSPDSPRALLRLREIDRRDDAESHNRGRELEQTVLQIQSPTLTSTYIQCPPVTPSFGSSERSIVLGIKHPWMHLQVRNLGREWSFEVGIVDHAGRVGIVRFSVFQKKPQLKMRNGSPPLLLLPISFPSHSSHVLTPWSTISINFPSILPHFSSPHLLGRERAESPNQRIRSPQNQNQGTAHPHHESFGIGTALPGGTFAYVSYVRVYATCRLRRIWFAEGEPSQQIPWEFELYAVD